MLLPVKQVCCLMSVRPRLKSVVYWTEERSIVVIVKAFHHTLVATTSWSRIPRASIHSPMISSEDSSW